MAVSPGMRIWHEETWDRRGTMAWYPSPSKNPDDELFMDCGEFVQFWVSRSGEILHDCPAKSTEFWYLDDQPSVIPRNVQVSAFGEGGMVLTRDAVRTLDGGVHPLSRMAGYSYGPSLAVPGSFLMTFSNINDCELVRVAFDGTVTSIGTYPQCGGVLEPDGMLTYIRSASPNDTIEELPVNGTPTTIYTEANRTPQDYSFYPPHLYILIHGSNIIGEN